MTNIGGPQNEQERMWNGANVGNLVHSAISPGGEGGLNHPGETPGWEMPLVPAFPMKRHIALITPRGAATVVRLAEKICVLGDSGVGKTSIVRRYAQDMFDDGYLTTCGANVSMSKICMDYPELNLRARLSVQIWDVTGERRGSLNPTFFRGASGALVVGDAVRLETQLHLWKWIEAFRSVAGDVPVVIVVNKTDIMDLQEFDFLLMDDISREYGCAYIMTSARKNDNIDGAFRKLCDFLVRMRLPRDREAAGAC